MDIDQKTIEKLQSVITEIEKGNLIVSKLNHDVDFTTQEIMIDIRLKVQEQQTTKEEIGFFIEELTHYRREVWPDCQPITGE